MLPTYYQQFIHKSRYAKYHDGYGRESWADTVTRYSQNVLHGKLDDRTIQLLEEAIYAMDIMPSMRDDDSGGSP